MGETLKTLTGTTHVERITRRPEPEPVYNIEVDVDHVYRVGESGLLVHNASEWSPQNYQAWFNALDKSPPSGSCPFPTDPVPADCQRKGYGNTEYKIVGGGADHCADGIRGTAVLECKAVKNEKSSPQLGNAPDFITQEISVNGERPCMSTRRSSRIRAIRWTN